MKKEFLILGENIRRARQSLQLSQEAMAEVCDFHRTYICDVERGARNVTLGSLLKLARGLGTTVSELTRNVEFGTCSQVEKGIGSPALAGGNTTPTVHRTFDHYNASEHHQNGFKSK